MKCLSDFEFQLKRLIHKVKRFLIAHPDDGIKFHQLSHLSETDRKLAELIRNPNSLFLFGSKMNVHPDDNDLEVKPKSIECPVRPKMIGFQRNFTNSKGNLFRAEVIFVDEAGLVSYNCLNRCFFKWMVYEPTLWQGAERFYYYLDKPEDINELLSLLMKSSEFYVADDENIHSFEPDPEAWCFRALREYAESLKGKSFNRINRGRGKTNEEFIWF